jgi:hypothetical protein
MGIFSHYIKDSIAFSHGTTLPHQLTHASLYIMSSKQRLSSRLSSPTVVQKVLEDDDLRAQLDAEVKAAGVTTSVGYQCVMQKFLRSDAVATKITEIEDMLELDEELNEDTQSRASGLGALAKSITESLLHVPLESLSLVEETDHISPLTHKSIITDDTMPTTPRSDSVNSRNHNSESSLSKSSFISSLKIPFNFSLKDELGVPKPKRNNKLRNIAPARRSSNIDRKAKGRQTQSLV